MYFSTLYLTLFWLGHTLPSAHAAMITAAPNALYRRQGATADPGSTSCDAWLSIEASCTAATPNFLSLAFTQEASCLCYSGTVWQPTVYDNYFETCLSHLSTASPSEYSAIGGAALPTSPCAEAGNVMLTTSRTASQSGAVTTPPASLSSAVNGNSAACSSWDAIEMSCSNKISSFTDLSFTDEASCLCYTSSTYAPFIFDGYWSQCLLYYSTASPTFYSSLGGDTLTRTPCAAAGNVASGPVAAATTTPSSAAATSSIISSINSAASATSPQAPSTSSALTTTEPTSASRAGVSIHRASVGLSGLVGAVALFILL
jgi:hypothetical protein